MKRTRELCCTLSKIPLILRYLIIFSNTKKGKTYQLKYDILSLVAYMTSSFHRYYENVMFLELVNHLIAV